MEGEVTARRPRGDRQIGAIRDIRRAIRVKRKGRRHGCAPAFMAVRVA